MITLSNYFIVFALAEPETNLKSVTGEILTIGRAADLMPGVWFVRSQFGEAVIRDRLRALMGQHDQLLVIAASNAMGFGMDVELWQAVKKEWSAPFTPALEPATQNAS